MGKSKFKGFVSVADDHVIKRKDKSLKHKKEELIEDDLSKDADDELFDNIKHNNYKPASNFNKEFKDIDFTGSGLTQDQIKEFENYINDGVVEEYPAVSIQTFKNNR